MATATAPDVTRLQGEIERIQSDLNAAIAKIRELTDGEWPNGHDSALAAADKMWTEVKRQAQQVGHEIEERPLVSAVTAFGAGIAIGMLFSGRRG
jgi:ElaB/YqjD/DUF883 family membrane-anchored ribosome-binding protein